jgi:hypothetical protein
MNPSARLVVQERKRLHEDMEKWLRVRGAWLRSVPGHVPMTFEAVQDSDVPEQLRGLGWVVTPAGSTMRIVGDPKVEMLTLTSSGAYEPAVEGSTKPPLVLSHAGIIKTDIFELSMPAGAKVKK